MTNGWKHVCLLSEELTALFPGQLIVERAGGLILIGLIWMVGEGHKLEVCKTEPTSDAISTLQTRPEHSCDEA